MKASLYHLILFLLVNLVENFNILSAADPTDGFIQVPLTEENFKIQRPYDIPLEERYSFTDGVRRLWVYADDKPHTPDSKTMPRTEIRISGLDYSSGVRQFEGYGFVPNGTNGAIIVQIHGAATSATTLILRIYEGDLRYYLRDLVATHLYDRWFRVNVIHNVDQGTVTVFIDGLLKFVTKDRGPGICTLNVGFMQHLLMLATTWSQGGRTSKYSRSDELKKLSRQMSNKLMCVLLVSVLVYTY